MYLIQSISHPGGLIEYLSGFIVQFFIVPVLGAAIESIIFTLIFIFTSILLKRLGSTMMFFIAPATVYLFCLFNGFSVYFYFQGILSFLLCICCLLIFATKRKSTIRTISVFLFIPVIYWIAGSVSVLFAICVTLIEFFRDGRVKFKRFYWLLVPIFALLVSWLSVRYSFSGNLKTSLLPDMYYQFREKPISLIYFPWISLIIWVSAAPFLGKINVTKKKIYLLAGIQVLFIFFLIWKGIEKYGDRNYYEIKKIDYFSRNGQWNKIIDELHDRNINNYPLLNYLNLALTQKGCLYSKMFNFPQYGIQGLIVSSNPDIFLSSLFSDINFCIGDIASSQKNAFLGNQSCSDTGSGRLLKRLVQTNLIYGEYAVAAKYIRILEHTFFYHKWAVDQRRFLYNDSLCMKDPVLSKKRKCLPDQGSMKFVKGFPTTLKMLTEINPLNRAAQEYRLASYLLLRDLDGFSDLLYSYQKKGIISANIPSIFQQALLIKYDLHPEKWKEKGITEKTIYFYSAYKSLFIKNYRKNTAKKVMQKQYGYTYWYYYQFVRSN